MPDDFGRNVRVTYVTDRSKGSGDDERQEGNQGHGEREFLNCLACGYVHNVVALDRTSGACHACGKMVWRTNDGVEKDAEKDEDVDAATALKDTLVRFDEEGSARTTVIDDQGAYYELVRENAWLDEDEVMDEVARERARESASERGHTGEIRLGMDLLGRRFVEDTRESTRGGDSLCGGDDRGKLDIDHMEVSERERPWGGARGVDGVGNEGRGGRARVINGEPRKKSVHSQAFMEFLEGREFLEGVAVAGLRFRRGVK